MVRKVELWLKSHRFPSTTTFFDTVGCIEVASGFSSLLNFSCYCFHLSQLSCRSQMSHILSLCFCTEKEVDLLMCFQRYGFILSDKKALYQTTHCQLLEIDISDYILIKYSNSPSFSAAVNISLLSKRSLCTYFCWHLL